MSDRLTTFARELRKESTQAEALLWDELKGIRFDRWKFRMQVPIGNFIADLCCLKLKVIVELDGDSHCERLDYDRWRDTQLRAMGYDVLRYENCVVRNEMNQVIEEIVFVCKKRMDESKQRHPHP